MKTGKYKLAGFFIQKNAYIRHNQTFILHETFSTHFICLFIT